MTRRSILVAFLLVLLVSATSVIAIHPPAEDDDPFARLVPDPTPIRLADGFEFTEGPCWSDGALYFCDLRQRRIYRWTPEAAGSWQGETEVLVANSRRAAGIAFDPRAPEDGGALLVTHFARQVTRLDASGELRVICERAGDLPSAAPMTSSFAAMG